MEKQDNNNNRITLYEHMRLQPSMYIGSANLTGAGMGMKGSGTRNFEAGILTNDVALVQQAINQYNEVWSGNACTLCKRKKYCPDPIA